MDNKATERKIAAIVYRNLPTVRADEAEEIAVALVNGTNLNTEFNIHNFPFVDVEGDDGVYYSVKGSDSNTDGETARSYSNVGKSEVESSQLVQAFEKLRGEKVADDEIRVPKGSEMTVGAILVDYNPDQERLYIRKHPGKTYKWDERNSWVMNWTSSIKGANQIFGAVGGEWIIDLETALEPGAREYYQCINQRLTKLLGTESVPDAMKDLQAFIAQVIDQKKCPETGAQGEI